ncbi:MAG: helicase HerA domain-containing protein [Nitrososphaerales archaeon]
MMIQVSAIPINYDLIIDNGKYRYVKGFSYPIIGNEVYVLNSEMIKQMYNQKVIQKTGWNVRLTSEDAKKDPRLGTIKMFEMSEGKIPIYVDFDSLVRHHFGIFSFTGGGKEQPHVKYSKEVTCPYERYEGSYL